MTAIKTVFTRHPVVAYFVLTFLTSWGGIFVVLGPGAFTGATPPTEGLLPLVYLAMLAGPSIAGILMTGLVEGKAGFHDLRSRLIRWRVDVRWYVVALLTAPLDVNPVIAVFLGWMFAGEAVPPRVLGATVLILAAVLLLKSGASPAPRCQTAGCARHHEVLSARSGVDRAI